MENSTSGVFYLCSYMAVGCRQTVLLCCCFCRRMFIHTSRISYYTAGRREADEGEASEGVEVFQGPVPRDKIDVTYSKSSGPGGQNVNKLNTKAEVRFHIDSADWIPLRVKERLKSMFKARVTKGGELVVVAQKHRSQAMNLNAAVKRVESMLGEASEVPKGPSQLTIARVKALKRKAERRRLIDKKYQSEKKQARRIDD